MVSDRERDILRRVCDTGRAAFTVFLDPAGAKALCALAKADGIQADAFGGFDDAERVMLCLHLPQAMPNQTAQDWPMLLMDILWSKHDAAPGHRDVLGALLALGVERDQLGDIRIDDEHHRACVCLGRSIGEYILGAIHEIGRATVRARLAQPPYPAAEKGVELTINVPAPRLDAILATAIKCSRAKAQEVIRSGRVQVNWTLCEHVDASLKEGDVLSIRGRGRARVLRMEGLSRKGRLFITIETFLEKKG